MASVTGFPFSHRHQFHTHNSSGGSRTHTLFNTNSNQHRYDVTKRRRRISQGQFSARKLNGRNSSTFLCRKRYRRSLNNYSNDNDNAIVSLASLKSSFRRSSERSTDIVTAATSSVERNNNEENTESTTAMQEQQPDYSYENLTILGRVVAGTVEIAMTIAIEYCTGFVGGYFLGSITDIPRLLTKRIAEQSTTSQKINIWNEITGRTIRMHTKSLKWAKSWSSISAAFGGFNVIVKVVRNGKEDEWNTVFSSMAAGAYFARKDGPQAMLRGALIYGGLVYLLSGNAFGPKRPFQYEEKIVDF